METNIVEVENFVQQSEERRGSAFTQEVKRYLERYPNTQYVDVLLTDLNGCFRGKRIPVSSLKKLEKGCYFPASVFAMDILCSRFLNSFCRRSRVYRSDAPDHGR